MDAVGLHQFLKSNPSLAGTVFPAVADIKISAKELLKKVIYDGRESCDTNQKSADFFEQYLKDLESPSVNSKYIIQNSHLVYSSRS